MNGIRFNRVGHQIERVLCQFAHIHTTQDAGLLTGGHFGFKVLPSGTQRIKKKNPLLSQIQQRKILYLHIVVEVKVQDQP